MSAAPEPVAYPDRRLQLTLGRLASPLGDLLILSDAEGVLLASDYADCEARLHHLLARRLGPVGVALTPGTVPPPVARALDAYFAGDLAALARIALRLNGSPFQNRAWAGLRAIPPGQTQSYGALAASLGSPRAARAVGNANHHNPYNLIVPCHRLVAASGALTGYAGGLERKRWLLDHEARHMTPDGADVGAYRRQT